MEKTRIRADKETGFPSHFHYDPYYNRFNEHVKSMVSQGNPIIVRIHPGLVYPMDDDMLHYGVDREGHVVAIVGYDDATEEFVIADPWNGDFNGESSGLIRVPYEILTMVIVDSTLDAMTIPVPWDMDISVIEENSDRYKIVVSTEYTAPVPLSNSYYHLHNCKAKINLPTGLKLVENNQVQIFGDNGTFAPREKAEISWKVEATNEKVAGEITVQIRGIVSSSDPYNYEDVIGIKGTRQVVLTKERIYA